MNLILFDKAPYVNLPFDLVGWIGWFIMAALLLWFMQKEVFTTLKAHFWLIFSLLLVFTVFANLFLAFQIPWGETIPLPNVPLESNPPAILLLAAFPLLISAGLLGAWPTVILGLVGGSLDALFNTHSIFTPLEMASLGLILALMFRQNYRSPFYKMLRHPLGAAFCTLLFSTPIYLISTFFSTNGLLAARLDYCFTQSWILMMVNGIQLLLAGIFGTIILIQKVSGWTRPKTLVPSPGESGLQARILTTTLPFIFLLMITLAVADWAVAGKAARSMIESQLKNSADTAAENIPYIIETGQSLVSDIVSSTIPLEDTGSARTFLQEKLRSAPYFDQLYLFDLTGAPFTGYPLASSDQLFLSAEEQAGITLALNGVQVQSYTVAPTNGSGSVQISFLAAIPDEYGLAKGVLLARTDLDENLFSQPTIQAFSGLKTSGGEGLLLDADHLILFDTNPSQVMTTYSGNVPTQQLFYDESSGTGTRRVVYAEPISEKNWTILVALPASRAQEMALQIAIPLLALLLVFALGAFFFLRYMMQHVTFSLEKLANQATAISNGSLEKSIEASGVDEIGRLSTAFEHMRVNLKDRLEELDRLLDVTQGIAGNLSIEGSSTHILKAALSYGANSARIVLLLHPEAGIDGPLRIFSEGDKADEYAGMDKVLLDILRTEPMLVIPSRARLKRMGLAKSESLPNEMLGAALRDGDQYLGILWLGYAETHRFLENEVNFFTTLVNQTLIAVTNSSLYSKAEVGKHRLESVLTATPDPVFLLDQQGNVLMYNQAAHEVAGLIEFMEKDHFVQQKLNSKTILGLIENTRWNEKESREVTLENGRIYRMNLTSIEVEEKKVGRVCVLHDVTDYKAMEAMKTVLVSTVSHDLQAPLNQLKGYVSMLEYLGQMNDQQKEYTGKIAQSADKMSRLVENLLNRGRVESGQELNLEKISTLDLLDQVIGQMQPLANQRKILIMKELTTAQEVVVEADRGLLEQALVNLIDNAIKFSHLNGKINIGVQAKETSVIFEVRDYGPGIAPLDLKTIFDGVAKGNRKENQNGAAGGFGLTIVKAVASRHDGNVWVESELGKGSTFYLEIPLEQGKKERRQ
jgi:signal transduction histidine kinase